MAARCFAPMERCRTVTFILKTEKEVFFLRERIIQEILEKKVIAIVRGAEPESLCDIAEALYAGGVTMVEMTFDQSAPESWQETADGIAAMKARMEGRMLVGAGTVTSPALVELAARAGAGYIISPDTDPAVIAATRARGLVSIPGAFTPTEAKQAHNAGADFVKLFPCVDGPAWLKALRAPLSQIRFLAVGGITADNAADFIRAGACGVGIGGALVNRKWVEAGQFEKITAEARRLTEQLRGRSE